MLLSDTFTSPFSIHQNYTFCWNQHEPKLEHPQASPRWTEREAKLLRELAIAGVMGGVQPQKYWPSKKTGRKAIRKLVRYGALIQHEMLDEHDRVIPLYTLGPIAARSLGIRNYVPAYYEQLDRQDILRRLAFVQLYLRFYQKLQDARIEKAKPPFVGTIFLRLPDREIGFRVGVLRGNLNDLQSAMRWETERHRTLIVAEKLMHCQHLLEGINIEVTRFTTDYDLFRTPLSEMFYFWDRQTNRWEREIIDQIIAAAGPAL